MGVLINSILVIFLLLVAFFVLYNRFKGMFKGGFKSAPGMVPTKPYTINRKCINCKTPLTINIPNGTTIDEYFKEGRVCSVCGCELKR